MGRRTSLASAAWPATTVIGGKGMVKDGKIRRRQDAFTKRRDLRA
jgi:hypothetical protein